MLEYVLLPQVGPDNLGQVVDGDPSCDVAGDRLPQEDPRVHQPSEASLKY